MSGPVSRQTCWTDSRKRRERLGFLTTEGAIGEFITSEEELGHVLPPLFFYIMWVPGGFLIGIARVRPTGPFRFIRRVR